MVMKIENYETWKGISADTFTFPYNPQSFDTQVVGNQQIKLLPYTDHHIAISAGGHNPVDIVLTGHFSGTNKMDNYFTLSKHFHETWLLKKLYFEDDKFYLGIGKNIKRVHSGGRTNFVDYVAIFQSLFGIQFGDTEKTINEGNVPTYITTITGSVSDGTQDIVLTDSFGNEVRVSNTYLNTGDSFTYRLVSFVESVSGIYITSFGYCETNGIEVNTMTKGQGVLKVASNSDTSSISVSNLTSPTILLRDGWSI